MSTMLELIDPAGAMLSMLRYGMTRALPSSIVCGLATSDWPASLVTLVLLAVIPSGAKIRSSMNRSQPRPLTLPTISPAVITMMF